MRPSGDQYRLLVEHSPVMLWRSGLDAKCDYFNETWLDFTGRSMAEEVGDGWVEGVHPEDVAHCVQHYLEHFQQQRSFEMVYRLRRCDGEYRYVFDRGVPYRGDDGIFAGFIGSCIDVHESEITKRAKSTFLSMMAHEQRTPLSAMKMFVASMAFRAQAGHQLTPDLFGRLNAQIDRFARLVDLLSETARLEEGRALSLHFEPLDLGELVARVVSFRAETLELRGERPGQRHAIAFSPSVRPCHVMGDALRLEQVFINLIDNAVKYSPDGCEVRVSVRTNDGVHEVLVADTGIGIPSCDLPALTQRYFRASNVSPDHFPGLGLGLALCREILEQHGGFLNVASELTKGTTVSVQLPAAEPPR
jgi:PAS domain S-box-containing protein